VFWRRRKATISPCSGLRPVVLRAQPRGCERTGSWRFRPGDRQSPGRGQSTTFGIVSALHRSSPGIANEDLIATDALIERGNSGGPLINTCRELVGISVARTGRSDGAGFGLAVPADAVRQLMARARLNG
jgi:hypothetical protein